MSEHTEQIQASSGPGILSRSLQLRWYHKLHWLHATQCSSLTEFLNSEHTPSSSDSETTNKRNAKWIQPAYNTSMTLCSWCTFYCNDRLPFGCCLRLIRCSAGFPLLFNSGIYSNWKNESFRCSGFLSLSYDHLLRDKAHQSGPGTPLWNGLGLLYWFK